MADLLIVADDLTGSLDTGACFARLGLRTYVTWGSAPPAEAEVWVHDTASRDLPPAGAQRQVRETVAPLLPHVRRVYKKVDSTLRGNVGAELEALLQLTGAPRAILAPAFPAQGRTVAQGRLLVRGAPLTAPGAGGPSVADLLRAQTGLGIAMVGLDLVRQGADALAAALRAAEPILVVDAVEEADLATLARAAAVAAPEALLAGSAGLAAHLPAVWGLAGAAPAPAWPGLEGPLLLVAGTQHPCLACQLGRLQAAGPVAVVNQVLGGLLARGESVIAERSQALAEALQSGSDAAVTTLGEPAVAGAGRLVAALLAQVAARALAQARPAALVLTGGDCAMAACRALRTEGIWIEDELEPGVACGRLAGGPAGGLPIVTKAGGFGDDDVLVRTWENLRRRGTDGTGGIDGTEARHGPMPPVP